MLKLEKKKAKREDKHFQIDLAKHYPNNINKLSCTVAKWDQNTLKVHIAWGLE